MSSDCLHLGETPLCGVDLRILMANATHDRRPLGVRVYEEVRDRIIDGRYPESAALVQEQIATELGISRTPLRDALNRLVHEGLVSWYPGNGYVVNATSRQDFINIYQIRHTLEVAAARLACGQHSAADLTRLAACIAEMHETPAADLDRHFELNREFHSLLIRPCANQMLLDLIDRQWDHPINRRITRDYAKDAAHIAQMVDEHSALVEAAAAKDEERFATLVANHLFDGYREVVGDQLERLAI